MIKIEKKYTISIIMLSIAVILLSITFLIRSQKPEMDVRETNELLNKHYDLCGVERVECVKKKSLLQ